MKISAVRNRRASLAYLYLRSYRPASYLYICVASKVVRALTFKAIYYSSIYYNIYLLRTLGQDARFLIYNKLSISSTYYYSMCGIFVFSYYPFAWVKN